MTNVSEGGAPAEPIEKAGEKPMDPRDIAAIYEFEQRSADKLALDLATTQDPNTQRAVGLLLDALDENKRKQVHGHPLLGNLRDTVGGLLRRVFGK